MRTSILFSALLLSLSLAGCKKKDEAKNDKAAPATTEDTAKTDTAKTDTTPPAAADAGAAKADTKMAEATIAAASGSKVEGVAHFMPKGDKVEVHVKVTGLTPGDHGFHIHETGDCSAPDAKSAGGHFNPTNVDHGAPDADVHHVGDLGNITANEEGVAEATMEVDLLSLDPDSPNNIVGRGVVVHGGADDMKSQPSGNAGPRVGCGVIELK